MAWTEATRSARSSAREESALSSSVRADMSSGEVEDEARERMRRYDAKRGRMEEIWLRTSL